MLFNCFSFDWESDFAQSVAECGIEYSININEPQFMWFTAGQAMLWILQFYYDYNKCLDYSWCIKLDNGDL